MKVLVISDTHFNYETMLKIINTEKDIELIIHAGDMLDDIKSLKSEFPQYSYEYVLGNNDFTLTVPTERIFEVENTKILLTHGHKFGVKRDLNNLYYKAQEVGANICIYGHTHIRHLESYDGIHILNPGYGGFGEYAVIDINDNEFEIELKRA